MPIIESLLDVDFYKFTMGQLVFKKYPDVPVKYAFRCRTKGVKLAEVIKEEDLRRELDHAKTRHLTNTESHYIRGTNEYGERMFSEDYINFLENLVLPEYRLEIVDGNYKLEFSGPWSEAIYWETIALAIINELYSRALMERLSDFERDVVYAEGKIRLMEKIKKLKTRKPMEDKVLLGLTFTDFGTRRRFSRQWQDYVVKTLAQELPGQFIGTSNAYLAMKHGLIPMGTSAHALFMIYTGIMHSSDEEIRASQRKVLEDWWDLYGWGLSIALTDTYGSDFFFNQVMTKNQARKWKGVRQDSGDPFKYGEDTITFFKGHGANPREKLLIFSDGLEVDLMIELYDYFLGRIKTSFGWGTNLTNDLGFRPLSLVIKAVEANGHGLVKLSDNLAKAIGSPKDIKEAKRIFGYTGTTYKPCRY